jgi:hypothetical protein
MDPQLRMMMELTYEALLDAGEFFFNHCCNTPDIHMIEGEKNWYRFREGYCMIRCKYIIHLLDRKIKIIGNFEMRT